MPLDQSLQLEHFFLGKEAEALLFEDGAGLSNLVHLDDQDGVVMGRKAGAVVEVDVVAAQQVRHRLEGAWFVGDLHGQCFHE